MPDRNLYPHLRGRQAKQRIAREKREAEELARRFDDRACEREASAIAAAVNVRLGSAADRRARQLAERDRQEQMREIERAAAEIELKSGRLASIRETVVEPTPEWFQHGDSQPFTPEVPDRTAIVLSTVRRVRTPIILRMLHRGQIDNDQYRALNWYSECYELAGLHGNIPIAQIGREVFGGGADRVLFTEAQQEAQKLLREVKSVITPHRVRFFEAVVIGNVPITRASRFIRTKPNNALIPFKKEAERVTAEVERLGILA